MYEPIVSIKSYKIVQTRSIIILKVADKIGLFHFIYLLIEIDNYCTLLCKRLRAKTTCYRPTIMIQNYFNKHVYKIKCKHYENSMNIITMYIEAILNVTVYLFKENVRNVL